MMLFGLTCSAQIVTGQPTQLPDKSYLVVIDGVEHRAFGPVKMRELEVTKKEHDAFQADNAVLSAIAIALTEKNQHLQKEFALQAELTTSYKTDAENRKKDADRNYGLFIGERTLRQEATKFMPHGEIGGVGGKVFKFLDGPYGQGLFKLVIPAAQFGKTYFGRCP